MKLYEFSVVVAAETEHEAIAKLEKAGMVGVDDPYNVRDMPDDQDVDDFAHLK
jgi:hypothetical protein